MMRVPGTLRERHVGLVTDNNDPEKRGRLKIRCDTLSGASKDLPDWVEPIFPFLAGDGETAVAGWMWVPDIGVSVEVEVASVSSRDDTVSAVTLDAPDYRWRACLFHNGGDEVHDRFKANYPHVRGFITAEALGLTFDDDQDIVELFDAAGSSLMFDPGGITVTSSGELLVDAGATLFDLGSLDVKTTSVKVYAATDALCAPVFLDGLPANSFSAKLAAALPELMAVATMFGIPTVNTVALIALLSAGAYKSQRIESE